MTGERVPPGQKVIERFPRLDLGIIPKFDENKWRLRIEGSVENPVVLTYKEVLELGQTTVVSDFHCVTGWSRLDNKWEGILFKTIITLVHPKQDVKYVTVLSGDGYSTSLPLSELMGEDVLLALSLDGKSLTAEHGGPLRLIVPQKYGYKSAKWVQMIKFTVQKELGYWEERGYSDTADPWTEDRYSR